MKDYSQPVIKLIVVCTFALILLTSCILNTLNNALRRNKLAKAFGHAFSGFVRAFCLCLVFIFLFVLNTADAQEENAPEAETSNKTASKDPSAHSKQSPVDFIANDIAALMHDDQYTLIEVSMPTETLEDGQNTKSISIPVFSIAATVPVVRGNFMMVPDATYNGASIQSLFALGKQLADLGWNSIVLPAPSFNRVLHEATAQKTSKQEDAPNIDQSKASENDELKTEISARYRQSQYEALHQTQYNRFLIASINAALETTNASGFQVIFAQGMSAQSIMHGNGHALEADAIIINNLYWPDRAVNQTLPNLVAKHPKPVLDLISLDDNMWATATQQARKNSAQINLKAHYRQRQIDTFNSGTDASKAVAKEIYGWLTYLGW